MERDVREQLMMWLEDMLSPADAMLIEARLKESEIYRQEYEELVRLERVLKDAAVVGPVPGFTDRFRSKWSRRRQRRRTWFGMTLLVVMVLVTFVFLGTLATGSGLALLEAWGHLGQLGGLLALVWNVVEGVRAVASALFLIGRALSALPSQPLFAGYLLLSVGLVWFWLQLVRRWLPRQPSLQI
jgi:hypothetical protein